MLGAVNWTARWYRPEVSEALPIPILGPDIFDPGDVAAIKNRGTAAAPEPTEAAG